ncbi:SDR family oxidoreductase [Chitinophagaceae bacterium MMS25-I14]
MNRDVFITGGTGYIGRRLIRLLLEKGFTVKALVRKGSEHKLPAGAIPVVADPFDAASFSSEIPAGCTFIQLLGVSHPGPKKKDLFPKIDLASAKASAAAAKISGAGHFIYVSVAQTPTRIMEDYQRCRAAGEAAIRDTGINASFIRPWYVIGPGHYWPLLFLPLYKLLEWLPATSAKARALRLVYLPQILQTLLYTAEHSPTESICIYEIADIRMM